MRSGPPFPAYATAMEAGRAEKRGGQAGRGRRLRSGGRSALRLADHLCDRPVRLAELDGDRGVAPVPDPQGDGCAGRPPEGRGSRGRATRRGVRLGLHGRVGEADVPGGRVDEDHRCVRARRRARRGPGSDHASAFERVGSVAAGRQASGAIRNTNLMPARLRARFGRTTAEPVGAARRRADGGASGAGLPAAVPRA